MKTRTIKLTRLVFTAGQTITVTTSMTVNQVAALGAAAREAGLSMRRLIDAIAS